MLAYQISTVAGKNQQFPKWYREYASLIEPQPNMSHVVFDEYRSRFFDLLNVKYVLTHASADRLEGYDFVASAEGVSVYENKQALARAFFVSHIIDASSRTSNRDQPRSLRPRGQAWLHFSSEPTNLIWR